MLLCRREATTGDTFRPLLVENDILLCWKQGRNVLKGSQRATLLRMSQPWVIIDSAETRVDVNLRFGSRLQVSPWSIHESSIPTRRVKRPQCPARNDKSRLHYGARNCSFCS
eukprot:s4248_g8.t1